MSSDWSHFVALQANWFVSVSPLAFCLGVLLSIVASERLGRSRIVKIWCQFFSLKFVFWYYFRKMMFVLSNSIPLLCFVLLYFAPNFAIMLGKIKSKLTLSKYSNLILTIIFGKIKSKLTLSKYSNLILVIMLGKIKSSFLHLNIPIWSLQSC